VDDMEERARDFLADHGVLACGDESRLAALLRAVVREEREACAGTAQTVLEPVLPKPCTCIELSEGAYWRATCICGGAVWEGKARAWCDRMNAGLKAAAAIRARGEADV